MRKVAEIEVRSWDKFVICMQIVCYNCYLCFCILVLFSHTIFTFKGKCVLFLN